jgi:hypothetical protein
MPRLRPIRLAAAALMSLSVITGHSALAISQARPAYTSSDLRNYAQALVEVTRAQRALTDQLTAAPEADRQTLKQEAAVQISQILNTHDFTMHSFNQMSAQIEQRPLLTQQVEQFVARAQLGI